MRRAAVRLAVCTALLFALPALFLGVYVVSYRAPTSSIWPHLCVIAGIAAGLAGIRLILTFIPVGSIAQRVLAALILSLTVIGLTGFYAAALIGLTFWGRVTTLDLAKTYIAQAPALLRTLGLSPVLVASAIAILILLSIAVALRFLERFDWPSSWRSAISYPSALAISIALIAISAITILRIEGHEWAARGEPLSLSLFPEQVEKANQSHGLDVFRAAELQRAEDDARRDYQPGPTNSRPNVVVIVVDALRADHLSLFKYGRLTTPQLEKMRDQGVMRLATSALSVCNESFCGLRALASSRYVDSQAESPITLHEVLRRHGYRVDLIFSGDHTNFYGIHKIYGHVDSYFDGATAVGRYMNDDRLVLERVGALGQWDGKPTMIQIHLMSAHALGERFEEDPGFGPGSNYSSARFGTSDAKMPQIATNFYDRGIKQADSVIADSLLKLKQRGFLDSAIVVITGDHGESLGERGLYSHTHSVWEESLRVPFLLLAFGNADVKQMDPIHTVSQIDVAPTVLHALGMPQPKTWQGLPVQAQRPRRAVKFQQKDLAGLVDEGSEAHLYKYWLDTRSGEQYAFDLRVDPSEKVNISETLSPALRKEWREQLVNRPSDVPLVGLGRSEH